MFGSLQQKVFPESSTASGQYGSSFWEPKNTIQCIFVLFIFIVLLWEWLKLKPFHAEDRVAAVIEREDLENVWEVWKGFSVSQETTKKHSR